MKQVIATFGQTIYDIVIQEYGCFEGIIVLLEDNKNLNLNSEIKAGDKLKIRLEIPELNNTNLSIVKAFKQDNIKVNSNFIAASTMDYEDSDFEPIDYL